MSELDCKTYSVFEIHPRATPKPSLTSRDHLHGRRRPRCCQGHAASGTPCTEKMSYLPTADSAMAAGTDNVTPGAADASGAPQQPMLTDDDLELSPEKRRKVCFAVCTLLLHTISMFSMLGESLYPHVPVRVSSVYVKVGESQENKNPRMTKSCTKSQPKATESNRKTQPREGF